MRQAEIGIPESMDCQGQAMVGLPEEQVGRGVGEVEDPGKQAGGILRGGQDTRRTMEIWRTRDKQTV